MIYDLSPRTESGSPKAEQKLGRFIEGSLCSMTNWIDSTARNVFGKETHIAEKAEFSRIDDETNPS